MDARRRKGGIMATDTPRLLITTQQAAEALGVSPRTLWSLTYPRGPLPCVRVGRAVRYDVQDLRELIAQQKEGGAA